MLVLEHSLIILLLLVGMLQARPRAPVLSRIAAAGALTLAFLVPGRPMTLPWEWLTAVLVPLLLWQAARLLSVIRWPARRRELALWLLAVAAIASPLALTSFLPLTGTFLFGLLAASMVWRAVEEEQSPTALGQIGPLALVFLLAEVAPAVEAPGRYLLALLGGAGLGGAIGYGSVRLALITPKPAWRGILSIGQVYLSYGMAWPLGVSSVAAAMFAAFIYVTYGVRSGLWPNGVVQPRPLDSLPLHSLAVLALAFFAWQTHVPLVPILAVEAALALGMITLVALAGRGMGLPHFASPRSLLQVIVRVAALMIPALLLWPRESLIEPAPLALALLAAFATTLAAHLTLRPLLSLYAWLDEAGARVDQPDRVLSGLAVREVMTPEVDRVSPQAAVRDLVPLLLHSKAGCLLVTEEDGRLLGIITEGDLFIQLRRLPRGGQSYPALFTEPVELERLPEVFAQRGAEVSAAQVMNSRVIWVRDRQSVADAIRLMAHHGLRRLPVVDADPARGGKVAGLLTRADVIRWLAESTAPSAANDGELVR